MALSSTKPDGTEGTAIAEITYNKGKTTKRLHGCMVKNDANLKCFLGEHMNDKETLKNTKFFFYAYDPDFKAQSDMKTTVSCHRYTKPKNPRSFTSSHPLLKVQEHVFLPCDSKDFNASKFLEEYSKKILVSQNLNTTKVIYGLCKKEGSPRFFPLKLTPQSFSIDAKDYEKLEDASPVLLKVKTDTGKDEEIVVGGMLKKEGNKVSISTFSKDKVADEKPNISGCDTDIEPASLPENKETVADGRPNISGCDTDTEPASLPENKETDGQPRPNVYYNIHIHGNPKVLSIGDRNTLMNAAMSTGKAVKDAVKNDQNPPNDNAGDETVNTYAVEDQNPPDDNVGDETVNTNVVEEQDPPDDNVGDETVNTNVVEEQDPPDDNVGDETVNTNVVDAEPHQAIPQGNAGDQNNVIVAVDGPDRSLAVIQPDVACRKIISKIGGRGDITNVDCIAFAEAFVTCLNLDRTSVETPPKEIMEKCQKLCCFLKQKGRRDIFEKLKTLLPNGMTGPRRDYEGVFQELPVDEQLNLTEAMTGNDKLLENLITELLGKSASQIDFYKRQQNPAEKIL